jgi:predicted dithiol-disulfide oxidoreductase (DUF899 family)
MNEQERAAIEEEIAAAEKAMLQSKIQLTELRKRRPKELVTDYSLRNAEGEVKLSAMFGDRDELLLIHNMGKSCPYCTLWADGFNGVVPHLQNRAAFVVVSPDDAATQKEFAAGRGWRFDMYSAKGTSFAKDMGFEDDKGKPWPGVSTFEKGADGKIYRTGRTYFGPGDDFCSVWHLFDLLPKGVADWAPKYTYE